MNRNELAGLLERAADLIEVLGHGAYRAQAYRRAARSLERYEGDLEELARSNFAGLPGIGPALAPMLREIVETGSFPYLEELEGELPPGIQELFQVQGLGPKRIRLLWEHGIDSLEALLASEGKLRELPGFGAKSEARLLEAARFAQQSRSRFLLAEALVATQSILLDLEERKLKAALAGSLRRGLETVGGIDLVVLGSPEEVREALGKHVKAQEEGVLRGEVEGIPLRIILAEPPTFGTLLVRATGSQAFVQHLGPLPEGREEEEVFEALRRPWVPPFWREPEHLGLQPPAPLARNQLKGLIHCHSTYSDGTTPLRELALAALQQGYSYMVISDHSQTAAYAGGLSLSDLQRQWREIEALNVELAPFRILKGIESEILPDGSLDYPEEILTRFDVVLGSLHSHLQLPFEEQTERVLKALRNPYLKILAHPTGRLLLRRPGAQADWERLLEEASQQGVVVELNGNPHRLDLDWRWALRFRGALNFSLATDAHSLEGLDDIEWALFYAQKAGLEAGQIANFWPLERWQHP